MCHLIQAPASPNKKQAPSPLPVFILHVCSTQVQASKQHSIASFNSQRARETYPTQTRPNFWRELSRNMLVHVSPHGMNHKPRKPAGAAWDEQVHVWPCLFGTLRSSLTTYIHIHVHTYMTYIHTYMYIHIRGDHQDSLKIGDSEGSIKRIK